MMKRLGLLSTSLLVTIGLAIYTENSPFQLTRLSQLHHHYLLSHTQPFKDQGKRLLKRLIRGKMSLTKYSSLFHGRIENIGVLGNRKQGTGNSNH